MQSDKENEMVELINDSDMEFIVPKEIELTKNLENASVLTPEVNVYVIEESTVNTKELETNIKSKTLKENTLMI